MREYREYLYKVLYNLKRPIKYISHSPFYGYSYDEAIGYIGKEKARWLYKEHQERMKKYKSADLDSIGLHTVESKKSLDKLYLLVNDMGYFIFDIDLRVLGTDPSYVKARIPGEGEYDILWKKVIRNEEKINEFTNIPIKVSFIDEYGIYNEGILYEFIEVMGCLAYGNVLSEGEEKIYAIPLFFLDKIP